MVKPCLIYQIKCMKPFLGWFLLKLYIYNCMISWQFFQRIAQYGLTKEGYLLASMLPLNVRQNVKCTFHYNLTFLNQ